MSKNLELGLLGQSIAVNASSNAVTFNSNVIVANTYSLILSQNSSITANGSQGTSGQVLTSNGSAVYWSTVSATSTISANAQSFTGNGSNTIFTLQESVTDQDTILVTLDGLIQKPVTDYTASGTTLTFASAPVNNTSIDIRFLGGTSGTSESFTGNGSNTIFTLAQSVSNQNIVLIALDGLLQIPTTDYTVSGTTLTFTSAPVNNTAIEVRTLSLTSASTSSGVAMEQVFVGLFLLGGM